MPTITVSPSLFFKKNEEGDFDWMSKQEKYKGTLFIIMENFVDSMTSKKSGGGTASLRLQSWPHIEKPRAAGIPTGYSSTCGGFRMLTKEVKAIIDLSFERIFALLDTTLYDQVVYSCDNEDPTLIGTGIFKKSIAAGVVTYISRRINAISDLDYPQFEVTRNIQSDLQEIRMQEQSHLKTALLLDVAQKLRNDNLAKDAKIKALEAKVEEYKTSNKRLFTNQDHHFSRPLKKRIMNNPWSPKERSPSPYEFSPDKLIKTASKMTNDEMTANKCSLVNIFNQGEGKEFVYRVHTGI